MEEKNKEENLVENEMKKKEENEWKVSGEQKKKTQRTREEKGKMTILPLQHLPYPHAPTKKDKERKHASFLDIFKQLQINIPFAEALEQMSTYVKFIKEILTKKGSIQIRRPFT